MLASQLLPTRKVASWVPPLARLGYAAKGVVYLLVGWIAIKAALASGTPQGSTGALASLTHDKGGHLMLMLIAVGLLAHVIWRLVQALLDPENDGSNAKGVAKRVGHLLSGLIYLSLAWTAWQLGHSGKSGSGQGQQVWVSHVMDKPMGTWMVMLAGIGLAIYGVRQIYKAWKNKADTRMSSAGPQIRMFGRFGRAARGFVMIAVGWFLFNAGHHHRADQAAGTQEVLRMLGHGWLLALVGFGLFAYGIYQGAKAIYRRIDRPA
ncbi:MAG: DUF1206 domain-containing protein [Pseudomonadota bacterium]|nr:DUF1206 domain-containing protein [Pseudomonadota bacterium]